MIDETIKNIRPVDERLLLKAQARQLTLTKPPGSLGRLEEIGNRLAAIQSTLRPVIRKKRLYVVAADHGVTAEGVSAYLKEVTAQMVLNFLRGGAAINVLARHGGVEVQVVDAGVDYEFGFVDGLRDRKIVRGTANMVEGPAMSSSDAAKAVEAGIELANEAVDEGVNLIGIGEMGIGNTTSASAITSVLTGIEPAKVTGQGTGLNQASVERKAVVIEKAIARNSPDRANPMGILAAVGGAEIGVMTGIVLGSAARSVPIVADGFISTAAACLALTFSPIVRDYLFAAHLSQEPGHGALLGFAELNPILDLNMRLGEGTGAVLAMHILEASTKLLSEMATFQEAGVSDKEG